jgi:hypothetical protein
LRGASEPLAASKAAGHGSHFENKASERNLQIKYNLSLNSTGYKSVQATCLRLPVRHACAVARQAGIRTCLRASHRQVGKSVIRGKKLSKAKKYSLTGK